MHLIQLFYITIIFSFENLVLVLLQATLATTDNSCESVVTSGQHHLTPPHPPRDASPAGLVDNASCSLGQLLLCSLIFFCIAYDIVLVFFLDFCPLQRRL